MDSTKLIICLQRSVVLGIYSKSTIDSIIETLLKIDRYGGL